MGRSLLFSIEADNGGSIVAYVVPDTGGTTPSVRVKSGGVELLTLEANDRRDNLVEAGRHSTGQCGFVIDDALVPGLAGYADLEIIETSSNLLVYRRRPPGAVNHRVFRLETHLLPLWRLDEAMRPRFQYWYYGVDRFGRETSTQVFCIEDESSFISGRLLFKNFEYYFSRGIKVIGMLRDPVLELAERLVLLKNIGMRAEEILGARDAMTFADVIGELQEYDLEDETACKRFFKRASDDTLKTLSNPLIRQLTGSTPDEMPGRASVASALDALASFEVLGLRSDPETFAITLAEVLGIEPDGLPRINEYPRVAEFAERLRGIHAIEDILDKDLEVFHLIGNAFEAVG